MVDRIQVLNWHEATWHLYLDIAQNLLSWTLCLESQLHILIVEKLAQDKAFAWVEFADLTVVYFCLSAILGVGHGLEQIVEHL